MNWKKFFFEQMEEVFFDELEGIYLETRLYERVVVCASLQKWAENIKLVATGRSEVR